MPGYDRAVPPGRSENRLPNVQTPGHFVPGYDQPVPPGQKAFTYRPYGLMPTRHGGNLKAQGFRGAGGVRFLFRPSLPGSERR